MEQIARDMREGTFPKKSEQTQREDAANAVQAEPQPGTQPPLYNPDDWGDPSAAAAQAALNPGIREALERIRDFPIGGHTAAGAMALIARQALASLPPSQ
jgi:hypothetical protein